MLPNPRHLTKAAHRLKRAQQTLFRRQKGSARREKARRRVARLHHKVAVQRQSPCTRSPSASRRGSRRSPPRTSTSPG
ncbi:transposase [Streptomyces sp. S5]|uniref:transposase n=1 Tax=Streptomyces sp. S5 TaxID=1456735 RepID=UPI0027D251ED|nr:transposase [Streptomyces sp. S5]